MNGYAIWSGRKVTALCCGELITASVRAFSRANEFFRDTPGMAVTTLKLPALGATFFWFQRLERERHRVKWAMEDWLLPLSPAIRGFDAAQPEPMPKGVELLHREAERVKIASEARP